MFYFLRSFGNVENNFKIKFNRETVFWKEKNFCWEFGWGGTSVKQ